MAFSVEERQEFKELVLPLLDDLHRLAIHFCRDSTEAEELVAETIMKACENFSNLREKSKVKPWLFRILNNIFLASYRKQIRHQHISYNEEPEEANDNFSLFEQLSQPFLLWWGNPERQFLNRILDQDLRKALSQLSEEHRQVILLCDVEELSYGQIAEILEVPVGTVRSRLARARSLLQRKLWHHANELGIAVKTK
ncbi:sigma-70 family RNA polymerase sigma factor [bacterium]|nr:sigma-70 family RNA polymerase sigma factor [bacterium]